MLILFPSDGLASGEASKSFPLQFGSISPGFVNGMQIPAPTNSAPPNLDEQQRDQVRHDSQRTAQPFPIPSVPKKQMPRKDGDAGDQSITGEAHQMAKPKREVRFSSVSPVTQTQKTSVHHGPGVSSPHMPPQLGNLGISIGSPVAQHQAGNYGVQRKPVKITHPDTHEELRLGGSSGTRSHPNVPQSQPITSIPPPRPINYYPNSYTPNSLFFPAPSSVPLTSTQINPSSQAPRFSYPPSQSTQTPAFVNPSAHNSYSYSYSYSSKISAPLHGSLNLQSNSDTSQHPKRSLEPMSPSVTAAVKESTAASPSVDASLEKSAPIVANSTENRRQTISRADSIKDQQKKQIKKGFSLPHHQAPVSAIPSVSEQALESEGEGTEYVNVGLVSLPAAASKDKPVVELSRVQRKKNETVASLESTTSASSVASKQEFVDTTQDDVVLKKGQHKLEPNDWEDADDFSTPRLEAMDDGKQVHGGLKHHSDDGNGVMTKKYSRDFLLKFSEQFSEFPEGLESTSDTAEAFTASNLIASRESHPSRGRIIQGTHVHKHLLDMLGILPSKKKKKKYMLGILSGPVQSLGSLGGVQRNTPDSDRWQRASSFQKGLLPSPQTPLQVMHKAEKKYEVGKETDEEVAKQRQLKAILNKLTPQNFEKLFEQVKAVNIDREDCEEKYAKVMGQLLELKQELVESSVVCGSNMVSSTPNDPFSLGDEVLASKESKIILDPEPLPQKGRPPSKRKQGFVKKNGKKKREPKNKTLSNEKAKDIEEIADAHMFGTQESVGNSYPCCMGQFLWPNMMPHNMRPTMAQGGAILPFSPSMAQGGAILPNMAQGGTGAGFDQFFYNFPTSQSNMPSLFNSEVWRGQSSIMSSQVWGGGQSNLMKSQGQGW
ncbi:hypothetical protein RHGRI_019359 [Rhododendron griersonianum]|uniref:Uncharacterized protein n=1 Tax=Rhododendron griersonianum TaxID=479676 RepID=A0AAV6JGL8_9ERIC|nr:hypothetical protein RHGRI_019359 [Rhododendron griersonianum]